MGGGQGTFADSRFLSTCWAYLWGEVTHEHLINMAVWLGFANVIDAFHVVNQEEMPTRFCADDRRSLGLWSPRLDLSVLGRIQVLDDLPCRGRLKVRQVQHAKLRKRGPGVQQAGV